MDYLRDQGRDGPDDHPGAPGAPREVRLRPAGQGPERPALASVKYHIEIIKRLDPAPGRKYSEDRTSYVVPDIIVTKEGDDLKITLNDEGLPRLRINGYYRTLLAKAFKENPDAYRFLKDKMKKALWFLRSLDQRDQTIYKVARYIVDKQKEFLEKGIDFIQPLTLMEIAQEIGVHESTVGRVVANKYIITPRGRLFPEVFLPQGPRRATSARTSPRSGSRSASGSSSRPRTRPIP